jgi:hypothetical protein
MKLLSKTERPGLFPLYVYVLPQDEWNFRSNNGFRRDVRNMQAVIYAKDLASITTFNE